MTYVRYRKPVVLIQVNGEPSPDFVAARLRFRYTDRIGKRNTAMLTLADPLRKFRDGGLQPDDHYLVAWGYPGNMSRVRSLVLKEWDCNNDTRIGTVSLILEDTGRSPKFSQQDRTPVTEMHKTHQAKHWGMLQSSDVARAIARRHGLTAIVQDSDDVDDVAQVQPANTSDYAYLRRLSENIDWEFFIENGVMFYRAKPYSEPPRQEFFYLPKNGRDTLLLSFTPKAKVTVVATRPTGVSTQLAEPPWILQVRNDVSEQAAALFNASTDAAAEALDELEQQELPEGASSAETIRDKLLVDPKNVSDNQDYQDSMLLLTERIQQYQQEKKEFEKGREESGKVNLKQKSKVIGADGQHDGNCPRDQQKSGKTPTGDAKGNVEVLLRDSSGSPVGQSIGASQSVVSTTAGTEKQRRKEACASHQKRKDKAVTATANFIGDPYLRAKVSYMFRGVGTLYEGSWYAKQVTHDIGDVYRVNMSLKRGALKKLKNGKGTETSATDAEGAEEGAAFLVVGVRGDASRGLETGRESVPTSIKPPGNNYTTADGRQVRVSDGAAVPNW